MQIMIDIPEEIYNSACATNNIWDMRMAGFVCSAIANGTPLPKGHGRLIDADELKKIIQGNDVLYMTGFNVRLCDINNTPTIVEADIGEIEDKCKNCKYYRNPDYTRCHECEAEREDKE